MCSPDSWPLPPLPAPTPAAIQHVLGVAGKVEGILEGSPLIDPMQWGWTTEEERAAATGSNVGVGGSRSPRSQLRVHHLTALCCVCHRPVVMHSRLCLALPYLCLLPPPCSGRA